MRHHDAVIIGVGVAGLTAAVRLAEEGARVLVVAKGVGATHLSPVTIDVLGYGPERVDRPLDALPAFLERRPDHPYRAVGAAGMRDAIAWFKSRFADAPPAGYGYTGDGEDNLLLPSAIGAPRPTAVVPETMAAGDLRGGGALCVVGFSALKDFHPLLLADNLARLAGVSARGIALDLTPEDRCDVNALGFARAFDDPSFRGRVVALLAGRLHGDERVGFPAVLGLADPHRVWTEMQERLGHPVFEIPTLPPSVPGMRVFAMLRERLRRAGGTVRMNNVVVGAEQSGGRVTGVRLRVAPRETVEHADWVVVATGGFASGGVELASAWDARETALGLPVAGVPEPGAERFDRNYFGEHPMARAGVAIDAEQRPVGPDGAPVFGNVLVAGATLAGAEPWREKSGDGLSLATGHRAAGRILEASGSRAGSAVAATGG
jgi:glycerol-3-phosphate dehydrogenase subunit B